MVKVINAIRRMGAYRRCKHNKLLIPILSRLAACLCARLTPVINPMRRDAATGLKCGRRSFKERQWQPTTATAKGITRRARYR